MAGSMSKRQQARNERVLQELIKTVPGNNVCADCQARNPGWASWSLGIFLCMRCAALHRKMGTHISKVKSLSMDSWSNDQVESMKRVGNAASNRIYNPSNVKPPIPFDADEADSAMERFIRQKYQERSVKAPARNNTGSTNSDDQPPPLPPKTGSRFGFRSASSIFPLSSKSKREAARHDLDNTRVKSPSPKMNKQSRVFGASVDTGAGADFEIKLAKLRDMGFADNERNLTVLKGAGGNLEKSIETLVRLGEGSTPVAPAKPAESVGSSRSRTPASAGLSFTRTPVESSPSSNNPFDMLDKPPPIAQPQSSQSTGGMAQPQSQMMGNNPYQQVSNSNPFGLQPSQSQYNLNQAFQNMSVSTPQQPLFPHHTGGFPGPQQQSPQQLYQQSMTPPVPSLPQRYYPSVIYENPAQQPSQNTNYNPFMQGQQVSPTNTPFQNNPFLQQQIMQQSLSQSPVEQSPSQAFPSAVFDQLTLQQPQPQVNPFLSQNTQQQQQPQMNPFFNQGNPQQQVQQSAPQSAPPQVSPPSFDYSQQAQYRQQTYPIMPQATGRADKRSILDLYNYPQLAPAKPQQPQEFSQEVQTFAPQPQRSVSSPVASPPVLSNSKNPFASSALSSPVSEAGMSGSVGNGVRHVSQESMSIDAGWMNGRHSPDAWGSISARSMR